MCRPDDDGLDVGRNWKPRRIFGCVAHDCIINKYIHRPERQGDLSLEEDLESRANLEPKKGRNSDNET